jgi:MerR family transcriptional regulator, thiopeptide resistance regulator
MHQARLYKAQEFAERAGVTVRTLHHYDRLGLLAPSGRSEAGYRLYSDRDLVRLEQILALKFIGFPLTEIRRLLKRDTKDLAGALRRQRVLILEKRRLLDLAVEAIQRAEVAAASGDPADWGAIQKIIEVIHMQDTMEWAKKYYSEPALESLANRQVSADTIEQAQRDWSILIKEVEAAIARGENPASPVAQALAERWRKLIEAFTGGDAEVQRGLNKLYADQNNWPSTFKKPYSDEAGAFMCEAIAIAKKK